MINFPRIGAGIIALLCLNLAFAHLAVGADPVRVTIWGDQRKAISPDLVGVFFEDLNFAADGGLYAELVENRSFDFSAADNRTFHPLTGWALKVETGSSAEIRIEKESPIHPDNPGYALVAVERNSGADSVRLSNGGYSGISVKRGQRYNLSLFARRISGSAGVATARLESKEGQVLAETKLPECTNDWVQHKVILEATGDDAEGRLVLTINGTGKLALDMVSLFPEKTFRGRANGLREDLAQAIADLKPKFMRFPGGCLVHGDGVPNIYRWKDTIGPVEQRKGQPNIWRYHQSVGLGYFEYFQFCEDIGAKPLPVVAAGVSCQNSYHKPGTGQEPIPMDQMPAYIQDVLDLIEWANGPADSTWGAKRAAAGHPKPFGLEYLGVGNEDHITPAFKERFKMIFEAIKAKHPEITVIGTTGPSYRGPDYENGWAFAREQDVPMVDEHYYVPPNWFLNNSKFYDRYPRTGPKVYLGEYAAHDANRRQTLRAALSEAAYLTALERNGDVVRFASYAPLLGKLGRTQWDPNLIYFDNTRLVPTVSYHVQKLFGNHGGDQYLQTEVPDASREMRFGAGLFVGAWETSVEFDDVNVTRGNDRLFWDDFAPAAAKERSSWTENGGEWSITPEGTYRQTGDARPALSSIKGVRADGNFVLALRARKLNGKEGFLIGFHGYDSRNFYWWNIGGFGNSRYTVEKSVDGNKREVVNAVDGTVEQNRWYDVRIESENRRIRCYINNKLIHEFEDTGFEVPPTLFASTVRDSKSGDVIIKMVNCAAAPSKVQLRIGGELKIGSTATKWVLTGDPNAVNSLEAPERIIPTSAQIPAGKSMELELPASSLTVLRIPPNQRN